MNHYGFHQSNSIASSMRGSVNFDDVVCPKPRRLSIFSATNNEPLRWQMCYQSEGYEPELSDIIFAKGGGYSSSEQTPFFSGSPPTRVANPIIQDAQFGDNKNTSIPNPTSSSSARCLGNKPTVRVEGFDCSIPALA